MSAYYFDSFGLTDYSFDAKNYFLMIDFTKRVKINKFLSSSTFLYDKYFIQEGERVEDISFKFYNTTQLHWVILLVNEIIDPMDDWCLSDSQLTMISKKKYANLYDTHHYVNDAGFVVDTPPIGYDPVAGPYPVSNIQCEIDLNEAKRTIKILKPELVNTFVQEFRKAIE